MNITDIDDKIIIRANEKKEEYSAFTKFWEDSFFKDMRTLNVAYPTYITRVTEYVPEVIVFIEKIIANGYAYASNGSVYFSILDFVKDKKHFYSKLDKIDLKDNNNAKDLLIETDGVLSKGIESEKKYIGDFVLWKKSKDNEPKWNSPWGEGRPGWHIECSVMSSQIFGILPAPRMSRSLIAIWKPLPRSLYCSSVLNLLRLSTGKVLMGGANK